MTINAKPKIYLIGTGGSISFIGDSRMDYVDYSYADKHLTIEEMANNVPEINGFADVVIEQLINVGSTEVAPEHWLQLSQRINKIFNEDPDAAGVAITHGTATLEETAYFLNLTVKSRKPVVITGAMRPPTWLGTDADINLVDCIRVAASENSSGHGVLSVLNNAIQASRDVTKTNSYRLETFKSYELGCLGYADSDGEVVFYRTPTKAHTADTEFDVSSLTQLPRVHIAYAYSGADDLVIRSLVDAGVAGIVAAGLGSGGSPRAFMNGLMAAKEAGVKVVIATQTGNGRIIKNRRFSEQDYLVADNLTPKKARILLMLGLSVTDDPDELQRMMWTY